MTAQVNDMTQPYYRFSYESSGINYDLFFGFGSAYRYDDHSLLIESKAPDTGWSYNIYNDIDQLVMSQDPRQRTSNLWTFYKYDAFGRQIMKGFSYSNLSRQDMQQLWDSSNASLWEERSTSADAVMGYTNTTPFNQISEVVCVTYYDNYDFDLSNGTFDNSQQATWTKRTSQLPTGSKVKILGTIGQYLTTVTYYDLKGQKLQTYETNLEGGNDRVFYKFDFHRRLTQIFRKHKLTSTTTELKILNKYEYDNNGRIENVYQRIGEISEPLIVLAHFEYNAIGQLIRKHLHYAPGDERGMQVMDYRYNEKGWLRKINNSNLSDDGDNLDDDDVFGEELLYTQNDFLTPEGTSQFTECEHNANYFYNGIPGAIKWNTKTPDDDGSTLPEKSYVYRYDDLYRLTASLYASEELELGSAEPCQGDYGLFESDVNFYTERTSYDITGNIIHMQRFKPLEGAAAFIMDELDYNYYDNSNKLRKVTDSQQAFPTDLSYSQYIDQSDIPVEFNYNELGNLVSNADRGLTFIYNLLDLPQSISLAGESNPCLFTYDGFGNKLKKQIGNKAWVYINGIEYQADELGNLLLVQISNETGCARPTPNDATNTAAYVFDYFIQDHLGNVRAVVTDENAVTVKERATMEPSKLAEESTIFENILPPDKPHHPLYPELSNENAKGAKLSTVDIPKGPSRLKAIAMGDRIKVSVDSWFLDEEPASSYSQTLTEIITSMIAGIVSSGLGIIPQGEYGLGQFATPTSQGSAALSNFVNTQFQNSDPNDPSAYLVYIYFNKYMQVIQQHSGMLKVTTPEEVELLTTQVMTMPSDGYFYTYLVNFSNWSVYFDNLEIQHTKGIVKSHSDYYSYGLLWENPAPASKYISTYQSKDWQQNEWVNSGLEMYDFGSRLYDPVLGRWHNADPMEQFKSPYLAMADNPVVTVDPNGEFGFPILGGAISLLGSFIGPKLIGASNTTYRSPRYFNGSAGSTFEPFDIGGMMGVASNFLSAAQNTKGMQNGNVDSGMEVLDRFEKQLPNDIKAPVHSQSEFPNYELTHITPETAKNAFSNQAPFPGFIPEGGGDFSKVFYDPNFQDGVLSMSGGFFKMEPNKIQIGWSSDFPIDATVDANGFIDAGTKTNIDSFFNSSLQNVMDAQSIPMNVSGYPPIEVTIYGANNWDVLAASNDPVVQKNAKQLVKQVQAYINENYSSQFHLVLSNQAVYMTTDRATGANVGMPLTGGQFSLSLHIQINVWGF